MAREYTGLGQYKLLEIKLITNEGNEFDLSNIMMNLTYHESIFENYMWGGMSFYDTADFFQAAPLVGEERIRFKYTTAADTQIIEKEFYVYSVIPSEEIGNEHIKITLKFVSREAMVDANSAVSKSYKNSVVSSRILPDIYSRLSTKPIDVDDTEGVYSVIIPNWSPLRAINWLASISNPANYAGSLYLFFENKTGFNFKHIESLYEQQPTFKLRKKLSAALDDPNAGFNIISHRVITGVKDSLKMADHGLFKTRVYAYDNVAKKYVAYEYRYDKQFDKTAHLHKFPIVSDEYEFAEGTQREIYIPTKSFRTSNEGSIRQEESSITRSSLLSQIESRKIELTMYGLSGMTCGIIVDVTLPNVSTIGSLSGKNHRFFTKNFLVGSVKHEFTRKEYMQEVLILDDSSNDELTIR